MLKSNHLPLPDVGSNPGQGSMNFSCGENYPSGLRKISVLLHGCLLMHELYLEGHLGSSSTIKDGSRNRYLRYLSAVESTLDIVDIAF